LRKKSPAIYQFFTKKKDLAYHGKFAIGKFIVVDVKEANVFKTLNQVN
jgi:hypothetical protein